MNTEPAYIANDYYPRPYEKEVFAVRVFNSEYQELSYTIPDIDQKPVVFDAPRVWSEHLLLKLEFTEGRYNV